MPSAEHIDTHATMIEAARLRRLILDVWPDATPFQRLMVAATAVGVMIGADLWPDDPTYTVTAAANVVARAALLQQEHRRAAIAPQGHA